MKKRKEEKRGILAELLGEPTPFKASGLAFTLAALLPPVLFFVFLSFVPKVGEDKPDWYLYASFIFPQLSFALVAWIFYRFSRSQTGMGFKSCLKTQFACKKRYYFIAIAMQFGLFSLSFVNSVFINLLGGIGYEPTEILLPSLDGVGFVGVLLSVALLPAIFEELIFRGVLLSGLKDFGSVSAALVCGGLFALYHQTPVQTVYQFVCGFAFAWVAIKAGSILPTVVAHFINNAFIVCTEKFGFPVVFEYALLGVSAVCLIFTVVWFLTIDKKTKPATATKSDKYEFLKWSAVGVAFCLLVWLLNLIDGIVGLS